MDTGNNFFVSVRGDKIVLPVNPQAEMPKEEALVFAAWIVALADDKNQFQEILEAVRNT